MQGVKILCVKDNLSLLENIQNMFKPYCTFFAACNGKDALEKIKEEKNINTLKELNETMHSINSLIQSTDEGVGNVKLGLENALAKTKIFSENIFGGFLKGFMTVYSLFRKR